jgi:hypothetical protein
MSPAAGKRLTWCLDCYSLVLNCLCWEAADPHIRNFVANCKFVTFWSNGDLRPLDIQYTRFLSSGFVQPLNIKLMNSIPKKLPITASFLHKTVIKMHNMKSFCFSSEDGSSWIRTQAALQQVTITTPHIMRVHSEIKHTTITSSYIMLPSKHAYGD